MTQRSKSTLFLIEQLIVIAVFAICAVACISILTAAHFNAVESRDVRHAILHAESSAEVFKATGGDFAAVTHIMGGEVRQGAAGTAIVIVFYDNYWKISSEASAAYMLTLEFDAFRSPHDFALVTGNIVVERVDGDELISMSVTAREAS